MKIDFQKGQLAKSQTANGIINAWIVQMPQVKLANITLYNVSVVVRDSNDSAPILIGSSLLNRFQLRKDQETMVLTRKTY